MSYLGQDGTNLVLLRAMAGSRAMAYANELLKPTIARSIGVPVGISDAELKESLLDAYHGLELILGHYAFCRRGKERFELSQMAVDALHRAVVKDQFGQLLASSNAEILWREFESVCDEHHRKPLPQLNKGVVAGMCELSQEIYQADSCGSIIRWIVQTVHRTGRIEAPFLRMVDVRGIGPKLSSLFLRDICYLFDLESKIDPIDRLYLVPIDKWMRQIAPFIIEEECADDYADWILAGKIAKYTRRADISAARFSMGTTYFGMKEVRSSAEFRDQLIELAHPGVSLR